jgi:hypothetical protein
MLMSDGQELAVDVRMYKSIFLPAELCQKEGNAVGLLLARPERERESKRTAV